jgi:acetoin utilization deacetylase AcuC-like enzyme
MLTLLFDQAATHFGQDYHQEQPARLINTEAYLLDKHPDWVWMKPRLASEEEVLRAHRPKHLERLRQPVDFDADTPYHPGIEEHARRAAGAAIGAVDLALRGRKSFCVDAPARPSRDFGRADGLLRFELDCHRCPLRAGHRLRTRCVLGL